MEPLDFTLGPPRSPHARLAGIVFTARVVDKLRASLPGGNLNGYVTTVGFSELWAYYTKIDLTELREVVAGAADEAEVERWIAERTVGLDAPAINAKMEGFACSRVTGEMRALFDQFYPAELQARFDRVLDLIEADDARIFGLSRH
ncbi:MAG TPA: DUF5069 domain-containing protein [Candidatus Sulfotelmatobacter sp.]|nr:DUF5069 domain-containing protein [Candidatus Sulfotelmatobacter sp.]